MPEPTISRQRKELELSLLVRAQHERRKSLKVIRCSNIKGDEATFTCGLVSGFRKGADIFLVEVTNKRNEVRHQVVNYTTANLQIPGGGESHVRKFVCEMLFQQNVLSRSEMAELIIIKPGEIFYLRKKVIL